MYGKDYNYAESRLAESIVRVSKTGEPVYVKSVNIDTGKVDAVLLRTRRPYLIHLDDLNLKPVPLGWCNLSAGGATYLCRIPKRQDWRQGIRAQTCFSSVVRFQQIPYPDLAKCITGEYPKFESLSCNPWYGVAAWSRKWASDGKLLYYGNLGAVGELQDNNKPILKDEFYFLKESLEKSLS